VVNEEQERILRMVYDGVISADEAELLLNALEGSKDDGEVEASLPQSDSRHRGLRLRQVPLLAGSLTAALGAALVGIGYASAARGVLLILGYLVLVGGILLALVGLWLAKTTWLRVRISGARHGGERLHLFLPVPLTLAAWAVRLARPYVHQFDMTGLDETILALRDGVRSGQSLAIDVAESDSGERVEVSIG
jgi:hypothetical protein